MKTLYLVRPAPDGFAVTKYALRLEDDFPVLDIRAVHHEWKREEAQEVCNYLNTNEAIYHGDE